MIEDLEFTRRLWMLRVGEMALGLGIAGRLRAQTAEITSLPPGLYQPMTGHLGHALQSADRFHSVPPGSPTDYVRRTEASFHPLFFSVSEFSVIRHLTVLILGQESAAEHDDQNGIVDEVTQWVDLAAYSSAGIRQAASGLDPLHRAVRAAYYGSDALHNRETLDEQRVYRDGLAWLEQASRSQHNAEFLALGPEDQNKIVTAISDKRIDSHVENSGTRFFQLLKSEVIRGFYTSRSGLKELDYKGNAFYARSPGCNRR
jgi:hypothetical protein